MINMEIGIVPVFHSKPHFVNNNSKLIMAHCRGNQPVQRYFSRCPAHSERYVKNFIFKYLFIFLMVCLATWFTWIRFDRPLTGIDDANIFFVYAQNVANGHGFVYNIGGEKVEGFSSLLWTLVCTAAFYLSDQPELFLILVNILILSLGITVAVSYIQSTFGNQSESRWSGLLWAGLFLALLVTSPTYLVWNTITLMENAIWSTLLLLATIFVIGRNISAKSVNTIFTPLAVLLLLTRPESYLWVGIFAGVLFVRRALAHGKAQAFRELIPSMLAIGVTVISLTVFRLLYFGYPLPNTYYAKVSPSAVYNLIQGAKYFVQYFVSNPVVSVSIVAAGLAGIHSVLRLIEGKFTNGGLLFLPFLAGAGLAVPLITGGDHFSSFRFYQGIYPILLLCLIYFISAVLPYYGQFQSNPTAPRRSLLVFGSSLGLLFLSGLVLYQIRDWTFSEEMDSMSNEFDIAVQGRETGKFAEEMFTAFPEKPGIGVIRAGGIKYTYPGEVIDLMGLNNVSMAHNGGSRRGEKNHAAFEKSTFYQLQPDVLNPEIVSGEEWQYRAVNLKKSWDNTVPLKGLYDEPDFLDLYVYARVTRKDLKTDRALVGWFEKNFLSSLESTGQFLVERFEYAPAD